MDLSLRSTHALLEELINSHQDQKDRDFPGGAEVKNPPAAVGVGGGVMNRAIGIDMYTLMCIKLMPNKNLQYKKTNKENN